MHPPLFLTLYLVVLKAVILMPFSLSSLCFFISFGRNHASVNDTCDSFSRNLSMGKSLDNSPQYDVKVTKSPHLIILYSVGQQYLLISPGSPMREPQFQSPKTLNPSAFYLSYLLTLKTRRRRVSGPWNYGLYSLNCLKCMYFLLG